MSDAPKKYCTDCKHAIIIDAADPRFTRCRLNPETNIYELVSPITDKPTTFHYCTTSRCVGQKCGPEGKLFETIVISPEAAA